MKRTALLVTAVATTCLLVAFAGTAWAFPGISFGTRCSTTGCHSGAGTNPVATLVSNDGTTATYNVSSGGLEWAVFNGATRVAGGTGSTGQFSVAVGGTYTLFAVQGFPGPLGQTTVTPGAPVATFTVMASGGPGGTISPGSQTVDSGSNLTYTITPDSGFHIVDVLVDGSSVGAVSTYTFTNITANHTIAATFAMDVINTFTITPSAGANGSISPSSPQTVASGADATFMITADAGFHVADVLVDGTSVGAVGSYSFMNVTADHTISASFAANPVGMFTITPSAGANGEISPATAQVVASGADVSFTITPDPGYHIESLLVDGVAIPSASTYTFSNVTADHTIQATFSNDPDVAVPTHLSLRVSDGHIRHGHSIRLSSVLSNSVPAGFFGAMIQYEVLSPGSHRWRVVTTSLADIDGAASSGRIILNKRGAYRFRARYLGSDDFLPSTSRTVKVVVS